MSFVFFHKLTPDARMPEKMTPQSTGYDLFSAEKTTLQPGERKALSLGFMMDFTRIDLNVDLQLRPRSGLAARHGITLLNAPGTIDMDYLGEWKVILINHGSEPYTIEVGDRVAQLVIGSFSGAVPIFPVDDLEKFGQTERGTDGFGSSGR